MTETYARSFPCGCFIELYIAYDWVDGVITIEEESVHECGLAKHTIAAKSETVNHSLNHGLGGAIHD